MTHHRILEDDSEFSNYTTSCQSGYETKLQNQGKISLTLSDLNLTVGSKLLLNNNRIKDNPDKTEGNTNSASSRYFNQVKKISMFLNPSLKKGIEDLIRFHCELMEKKFNIGVGIVMNDMDKQAESLQIKLRERKSLKLKKMNSFKKNRLNKEKIANSNSKSSKKHKRNLSNYSLSKKFAEEGNLMELVCDSGDDRTMNGSNFTSMLVICPVIKKPKSLGSLPSISLELNKALSTLKDVVLRELEAKLQITISDLKNENETKIEKFKENTETQIDFEIMIKSSTGKCYY